MKLGSPRIALLAVAAMTLAAACSSGVSGDGGTYADRGDATADATHAEASADDGGTDDGAETGGGWPDGWPEGGFEPRPGPLTFVTREIELTTDRLVDFDGDGVDDNVLADAGPDGLLIMAGIGSVMQANIDERARWLFHFPWVDDAANLTDESLVVTFVSGCEGCCGSGVDDPDDDWEGDARFCAHVTSLDACGEPFCFGQRARLDRGVLTVTEAVVPFHLSPYLYVMGRSASAWGTVEAGGGAADVTISFYVTMADMAAYDLAGAPTIGHLDNLLVALALGGAAFGMDTVPGLQPDVDLDGDGLERVEVGSDRRVARCIDGDDTVIEGSDCVFDDRMADAFAASARYQLVSALFEGRQPGWEEEVAGVCESPPETSLFDAS